MALMLEFTMSVSREKMPMKTLRRESMPGPSLQLACQPPAARRLTSLYHLLEPSPALRERAG
jgi:hypothetical protein